MKKEYIDPQLEVIKSEEHLMQQVSIDPDQETTNNDSLELDFEDE